MPDPPAQPRIRRFPNGTRAAVAVLLAVFVFTRWFALSSTLWDWDEALFCLALDQYDVYVQQPHPPGFPLYVFAAKLLSVGGVGGFQSLQAVNFCAALVLPLGLFFLFTGLQFHRDTAVVATILTVFTPTVWFYGGTGFSDVTSLTLVVWSAAVMFHSRARPEVYWIGAGLLGAAVSVRVQNVLVGVFPAVVASFDLIRKREWSRLVTGLLAASAIVVVSYGGAILASGGFAPYADALARHKAYVTEVDSFRNPIRPPLSELFSEFFVTPYGTSDTMSRLLSVLAIIGLIATLGQRAKAACWALATFGGFAIFAWLMLDVYSVKRLSVGYLPLLTLFAGVGVVSILRVAPESIRAILCGVTTTTLVIALAVETIPGLWTAGTEPSPPVAAMDWVRAHENPGSPVIVGEELAPFGRYLLAREGFDVTLAKGGSVLPESGVLVAEGAAIAGSGAIEFARPGFPARMARDRFRVVRVSDLSRTVSLDEGWYPIEWDDERSWAWMGRRSTMTLPSSTATEVALSLEFPASRTHIPGWIEVEVDGTAPVCFQVKNTTDELMVPARPAARTRLTINVSSTFVPGAGDGRELGLRLNGMRWLAIEPNGPRMLASQVVACEAVKPGDREPRPGSH